VAHYLTAKKILTARLAIVIYKIATLQFYDSDTKIGKFYRYNLGIRSKAYKVYNNKIVKVYNLNNAEMKF